VTTIGVVGLGRTGMPVAHNLIARGHRVVGYRRSDASALVYAGGSVAGSVRDVAVRATTILTVLPSAAALDEVITGMLPVLGEDHVVIELGSHPPADKERQRAACAGRGATFLDGEISGTPAMVAARRAVLLVAGDRAASEAALAVCRDVTDHARYAGAFGAATQLKLVANLLVAVHTAAAAEAMLLVERAGLDPALAIDVLGLGAGGSTMFATRAPAMTARRFVDPAPGPVAMLAHYLAPIEALARASRAPIPMFEIAAELYRAALADGRADQDIACVIELLDAQKGPLS
jgi:3-hydroxyisobutyrate dehydrogenase